MAKFRPGKSGNPKGRPKGTRNRLQVAVDELLQADAPEIVRVTLAKAKEGDAAFVRMVLDRITPPAKDRSVAFEMPDIESAQDAARAAGAVLRAVADGELTPSEAGNVTKVIGTYVTALEISELEQRIAKLEAEQDAAGKRA
jgi:Arc/MetJ family transcription regulator